MDGAGKKAAFHEQSLIDKLVASKINLAEDTSNENSAIAAKAGNIMITLAAIGAIFAAVLGFFIARNLVRQLGDEPANIANIAERMAAGDLTIRFDSTKKEELGVYLAMKNMVLKLQEVVMGVKAASDNVSSGS
jgi:methyl-accepting chemotaxis protein